MEGGCGFGWVFGVCVKGRGKCGSVNIRYLDMRAKVQNMIVYHLSKKKQIIQANNRRTHYGKCFVVLFMERVVALVIA